MMNEYNIHYGILREGEKAIYHLLESHFLVFCFYITGTELLVARSTCGIILDNCSTIIMISISPVGNDT